MRERVVLEHALPRALSHSGIVDGLEVLPRRRPKVATHGQSNEQLHMPFTAIKLA